MKVIKGLLTHKRCKELMATARDKDAGKPIANNTRLYEENGNEYTVYLHGNLIMRITMRGWTYYDGGGYRTVTTKARLNEYGPNGVSQKNWEWYVGTPDGKDADFVSGIFIDKVLQDVHPSEGTYVQKMKSLLRTSRHEITLW